MTWHAFPRPAVWDERHGEYSDEGDDGMTLRDYFAARAMQALAADVLPNEVNPDTGMTEAEIVARSAYWIADAMLQARQA